MRTSRRRAILAGLLLAVGLACCAPDSTPKPGEGQSGRSVAEVREMLRQRAQRLSAGDVEGYLAPLDPAARAVEEPIARGATTVALGEVNLAFTPREGAGDAPAFTQVPVEVIYRYKELPDDVFRLELVYDMERRPSGWAVTRSEPNPATTPFWATGPVRVERTDHFLALARPGTAHVQAALDLAEKARADLAPKLTIQADARHLVILVADHAELVRTIGEDPGPGLAALTRFIQRRDELPTSRHLVVDLDYLFGARASEKAASHIGQQAFPVEVFQHELAHLALLRLQFPTIPGWVAEGAAMFLSGERRLAEWQAGLTSGEFERISFSRLGGEFNLDTEIEYAYANAAVTNLVEAFGVDKFWAFYRGFKRRGDTADVVLRLTYGFDEAELDRRTREWIRRAVAAG